MRRFLSEKFPTEHLLEQGAEILSGLIIGVVVLVVFGLIAKIVADVLKRVARRSGPGREDVIHLIAQTVRVALYAVAVITALGTAGVNVAALVASLGLTGFALGFAFKDALSNLLAGALILFYRPFARGSQVTVQGFEGTVVAIDLRFTTLSNGEKTFLIPNSNLLSNVITVSQPKTATASSEAG